MTPFSSVAPKMMSEVSAGLASAGYELVASQVEAGNIDRCTYDHDVEAGYVYFVRPKPSAHFANLAAPVARIIPFLEVGFNVDVDHDGNVFGIEFLDRSDFFRELRDASVL